ncbi:MAG: NAD(P)/FAD-dependent oxidoreductase [Solirubrobacteraceae bacterium]
MAPQADIAVIGAGIIGLSTAFALTEEGASVAIYERGVPGSGQSGGESRIFRHAHDDRRMVAFAREARGVWREWEERFGRQLLSRDGVISIGPAVDRRLAILLEAGGVRAGRIATSELAEAMPLLAPWDGPAMLDEDGGVIRARAAIEALTGALASAIVAEEVLAMRVTSRGSVEVRTGGTTVEYERAVLCAGRGTAALARSAGIPLPVRQAIHARLTYAVRGEPPERLPCLLAGDGTFGEPAYGDAMPGNEAFAIGLGDTLIHEDGSLLAPTALAQAAERTNAYVSRALPGLDPDPIEVRHCWVTELPWHPDGIAIWEAEGLLILAGGNMFKHAPLLGRRLARAVLGDGVPESLHPQANLGAERFTR